MLSPETLRRYPLFAGQGDEMLSKLAMLTGNHTVKADDWLFHQGQEADNLYVVLEGAIALTMEVNQQFHRMDPQGPGELVGWSAMVSPHVYTLGAQAVKDTRTLALDAEKLRALFEEHPQAGYRFMCKLAEVIGERLNFRDTQLASMVLTA